MAPSDYRGATVGISASTVADRALRALGATPVASAFEGADINGYDGIELQLEAIAGNQYDRAGAHCHRKRGSPAATAGDPQRCEDDSSPFQSAGGVVALSCPALTGCHHPAAEMDLDVNGLATMCRRGELHLVTATPGQLSQLRSAFQPVYAWLREDKQTGRFLDQIEALRGGGVPTHPRESLTCARVVAGH